MKIARRRFTASIPSFAMGDIGFLLLIFFVILFLSALFTFLIGIVSEQVSALHYKDITETRRRTSR